MPLPASTRLGPYEIVNLLGSGGMGEVYRARDVRLERDVAIKVLPERLTDDQQALARFQREARSIAALSHPNIVAVFDMGVEQGKPYVVMELLEGETLGRLLKRAGLEWHDALRLGTAIAEGVAAAHAKGIIHRDLKPENIYLTAGGGVKVLDFGLARLEKTTTGERAASVTLTLETQLGVIMGTVYYMAPEQVRGQQADARSDVFALGCVLFEMTLGHRPFAGDTTADVMAAILHGSPPMLSESGRSRPAALDRIISRCLEKDPARRFPSAIDLAAALKAVAGGDALHDSVRQQQVDTRVESAGRSSSGPSVAVLPFVNMSSDPENEYFSDGLAEELINVLSKVQGLRVASRTSAFAFKGKSEDIRRIGEQLNVRTVLQGSVRKSGARLRITAQLGNVADGFQLWSETFNRQLEDIFAIQDEIAQSISKALRVLLTDKDQQALERRTTADVRAYDCYLRGRQFFHQFRRRTLEAAVVMFGRAIEIDPNYARAHAGLADCYSLLYTNWGIREDTQAKADAASRKALELDPQSGEAHTARGVALSLAHRYEEARQEFETAIRLDPSLFEARYFFARVCLAQGRMEEAARHFEEASQVRPEDYQALLLGAPVLASLGKKAESEAAYRRGLKAAEEHLRLYPDGARALCLGATGWCGLGDRERAREWARRALAVDPDEAMTLYNVACVYSLLGETDEAINTLSRAVEQGFTHKEWIQNDSDFNSLHGHPRFQALLDSI